MAMYSVNIEIDVETIDTINQDSIALKLQNAIDSVISPSDQLDCEILIEANYDCKRCEDARFIEVRTDVDSFTKKPCPSCNSALDQY
ncbi:hypothetical protein [Sphaerothrix gracilis]|uniref:hypothetical protein n=1 Tax=Sphaerothrix gracilis TaxID=3151835 RepID=UPI0031FC002A